MPDAKERGSKVKLAEYLVGTLLAHLQQTLLDTIKNLVDRISDSTDHLDHVPDA